MPWQNIVKIDHAKLKISKSKIPMTPENPAWQQGYITTNGIKLHYVTQGEGPLMLMLHGFPEFWYSWRHQIPEFAQDYKVVALDLRGYNESDKPPELVNQYMREFLAR